MRTAAVVIRFTTLAGALAACSSLRLPEADMAIPLAEVQDPFVIRVGERTPEALHPVLVEAADRAGRDDEQWANSLVNVLIIAGPETPWIRVAEVLRVCGDPEVRADRIWFAVRRSDETPGALAHREPGDRCACGRHDPPDPGFTHRIRVERGSASSSALYRWCRPVRRDAGDATVLVAVELPLDAPCGTAIAVVNEARRFGFGVEFSWPSREGQGSGAWGYDLNVPASAVPDAPPPAPGRPVFGDPRRPPKFAVDYGEVIEPEEGEEPPGPFGVQDSREIFVR